MANNGLTRRYDKRHGGRFGEGKTALQRFVDKCEFKPATGCVIWIGGTTAGRGKTRRYGSFWFEGRRWTAHRWAAKYIHGFDISGLDVDHQCLDTLCQRHLQPETPQANAALHWIRLEKGVYGPPEDFDEIDHQGTPFHSPPIWLPARETDDEPPF